jgi:hypothetical protein
VRQIALPATVAPGETVDVSVQMKAPVTPGTYQSNWLLESPQGARFGVGPQQRGRLGQNTGSRLAANADAHDSAACTNAAAFVADISIPDDSEITTGASFIKTWRIRNSGTCTWDGRYKLAHVDGHLLGAVVGQMALPASVAPGQTIDLSVQLTAPAAAGSYRGDWKLVTPQNNLFGVGSNNAPLWVKIKAISIPTEDSTISGLVYQDQNENGRYDNGEQLMGNREVRLIEGTACHVLQNAIATTYSGADGRYNFNGRFTGSYCVGLMGSDGLLEDVAAVAVTGGQVVTNANLRALIPNGSISGYLWDDTCLTGESGEPLAGNCVMDGNGVYHADGMIQPSETYIAGVTISLRPGPCTSNSGGTVGAVTNRQRPLYLRQPQPRHLLRVDERRLARKRAAAAARRLDLPRQRHLVSPDHAGGRRASAGGQLRLGLPATVGNAVVRRAIRPTHALSWPIHGAAARKRIRCPRLP